MYLQDIANILRRDSLKMTTSAGSGHPTSCMSCAEIISSLFFKIMKYDTKNPFNEDNDEFILSKGHAAPILYSALFRTKAIKGNLLSLRKFKSKFEGHPIPSSIHWAKVATGSLGQGLSVGVGISLAAKLNNKNYHTYVLLGDSELAEGSNYEAFQLASYYKLNNLTTIIDVNRLGQRGETTQGHNLKNYKRRLKGFGLKVMVIDGHNLNQILKALNKKSKQPKVILAKTFKGKGFSFIENKENWHGKALSKEELELALEMIPDPKMPSFNIEKPKKIKSKAYKKKLEFTCYTNNNVATRKAYGNVLANLASVDNKVLALDAEVSNSTYSKNVKKNNPNQFIECFIAEQNMIGMALGLSKKGFNVFASSFSAFLSRAHDQIRMASLSSPNFSICGSHSGISIGQDGSSQMGLEDIAMFRSLPNSLIFYPSDANSTEKLTNLAYKTKGLKYIRTTRADTPIIYNRKEKFELGDFKVLEKTGNYVLAGSGITLHECLKASEILKNKGIKVCVIDLYCIKPFNEKKFINFINKHGKKIVLVEDHYKEGGIGEMILSVIKNTDIKMKHLAINKIPHSGRPDQLLKSHEIDSQAIIKAVKGKWS